MWKRSIDLDHDADAEAHEWLTEVNDALPVSNDGQRCYCQMRLL